ncbi:EamA family transporter [Sphingomonas colocasiae]|uniref:EamA family transporter n=1 Tax=Sphingomonas colocasiae TaxID=1848973 RepID=A0ABS7PVI0_9SPHN|nr:EamA family transporter [Sphingomonas colocasiae]MBY8825276.1 EamA family transporter [Sphingomonas colocasiae]
MPIAVFGLILFAALLHAGWNAIVKRGSDTLLTTVLVTASAALVAAAALPLLPAPAPASWPFIAVSALFQIVYFILVAAAYRVADMSQAYPLMRGAAPLLVALASAAWIGEPLSASAWAGVAVLSAGIFGMAADGRRGGDRAGLLLALLNALVIAGYTVIDGLGVRRSGAPAAYTLWIFLLTGLPLAAWALLARRRAFVGYAARNWHLGMAGGLGTLASYGLALWAMTMAPVAVVAALRETSILFGVAISGMVLKERVSTARIVAVCVIAAGAAILRSG